MRRNHDEGFSLVELAIVLVIAGIVLAIASPGMIKSLNAQRVRDGARVLSDEMRLARQKAVANNTRNWVYTSWGANSSQYWTGVQTVTSAPGTVPITWSSTTWRGPIDLPDRTKQVQANFSSVAWFYFEPNGRPNSSGSVRVCSTLPSITDTTTVNVDLSGSVW